MQMRTIISIVSISLLYILWPSSSEAQIAVNRDGNAAHSSAILDVASSEGGFIMPRLNNVQRGFIANPAEGLLVYQTNSVSNQPKGYYMYQGGSWVNISSLETFRGNINMGITPTILDGTITSGMVSTLNPGEMRVDFTPAMSSDYVVIVTPEFLPNPAAPVAPASYCVAHHNGDCSLNEYQNIEVAVFTPSGTTAADLTAFYNFLTPSASLSNLLWHWAVTDCNTLNDYHYHPDNGSVLQGPSGPNGGPATDIYNDNLGAAPGIPAFCPLIDAIAAGSTFDIVATGNEQGNILLDMNTSVFIDWNSDGDFFDEVDGISETVVSTPLQDWPGSFTYTDGTNVFAATVPPSAVDGPTTMRVMATRFDSNATPCMVDSEGLTRDYVFTVSGGTDPVRPGVNRTCNIHNQSASGFEVRCYDENGTAVDDKVYLIIDPK